MQSLFVWGWEGADAPTPARGQDLQPYGALDCFEWRSEGGAGKQQAGRTAVRAAPIVCPEESPQCFLADYGPKGCRGRAESPLHCVNRRQLCRKQSPFGRD